MSAHPWADSCRLCGRASTWYAIVYLRDLAPLPRGKKPADARVPTPIHGVCDECLPQTEAVSASDMLAKSWPELRVLIQAIGLPVPPIDKATVQWERTVGAGR